MSAFSLPRRCVGFFSAHVYLVLLLLLAFANTLACARVIQTRQYDIRVLTLISNMRTLTRNKPQDSAATSTASLLVYCSNFDQCQ